MLHYQCPLTKQNFQVSAIYIEGVWWFRTLSLNDTCQLTTTYIMLLIYKSINNDFIFTTVCRYIISEQLTMSFFHTAREWFDMSERTKASTTLRGVGDSTSWTPWNQNTSRPSGLSTINMLGPNSIHDSGSESYWLLFVLKLRSLAISWKTGGFSD